MDNKRYKKEQKPEPKKPIVTEELLKEILVDKNAKKLNDITSELGEYYADGRDKEKVSSSQIRNVLDHLQRMNGFDAVEIQLLRPKLAYIAGKDTSKAKKLRHLQEIMNRAIKIVDEDNFSMFINFFEGIVAYHRFYEKK